MSEKTVAYYNLLVKFHEENRRDFVLHTDNFVIYKILSFSLPNTDILELDAIITTVKGDKQLTHEIKKLFVSIADIKGIYTNFKITDTLEPLPKLAPMTGNILCLDYENAPYAVSWIPYPHIYPGSILYYFIYIDGEFVKFTKDTTYTAPNGSTTIEVRVSDMNSIYADSDLLDYIFV